MRIIKGTKDFFLEQKSAVAIGKFDGIHKGHQKLLERILSRSAEGLKTVIFTFDPTPAVFFGRGPLGELTTMEEKRRIFEKVGVDVLVEYPMDWETADMLPDIFIRDIVVQRLNARFIAAGTDLSFGREGMGNCALLREYARGFGYQVEIVEKVSVDGREVSSTYIREEVSKGNMEKVAELIGFPYSVTGTVVHGNKFGRTIGMPTVNLLPPRDKLLPPRGVYYSSVSAGGQHFKGITNIGIKPTVSEERVTGVETFLYDFDGDLYGKEITVKLLGFKRAEMRFESKEELKRQMQRDIEEGRK